jgi:RNA polymerase sigma-70 factor (ECF subfamily)
MDPVVWRRVPLAVVPPAAEDLVERVAGGDADALGALYDLHHAVVRAFARRLLGNQAAAEDLVQDVFVSLPAILRRFEGRSSVRTFILSVAANHARHHARGLARRLRALERMHDEPARRAERQPDEEDERHRLAEMLERALAELTIDQRLVVVLCSVEERSSVEAAEILGVPEGTVRTRLFHARRKLRALLCARDADMEARS